VSGDDDRPVEDPAEDQVEGSTSDGATAATGPELARAALARAKEQARARGVASRAAGRPDRRRRQPARPAPDGGGDPTPFGAAIRELMAVRGWEQTERVAAVMGRWEQLVGPDIAAHCRPESLRDGELVLVAESTAWATQLRLLARTMTERLAAELGPGLVRRIRVHGPTAPSWQKGPRRVTGGRGPRDTYG
jgi:predicted nucleic acid-binding Zn ribbon protein